MDLARTISGREPMQRLSERFLQDLLKHNSQARDYESHHEVHHEGDPNRYLYFVQSGWLYSYSALSDGHRQITMIHRPGNIIGIAEARTEIAGSALRSVTTCRLYPICKSTLRKPDEISPILEYYLLQCAIREQDIMRRMLVAMGQMGARARVVTLLLILHESRLHTRSGNDCELDLPLTQTEIGDMTGLTNVTVSKTMCQLAEDGYIRRMGSRIVLVRLAEMKAMVNFTPTDGLSKGPILPLTAHNS